MRNNTHKKTSAAQLNDALTKIPFKMLFREPGFMKKEQHAIKSSPFTAFICSICAESNFFLLCAKQLRECYSACCQNVNSVPAMCMIAGQGNECSLN